MRFPLQRTVALFLSLLLTSVSLWASACPLRCTGATCCAPHRMSGMVMPPGTSAHLTAPRRCPTCAGALSPQPQAPDPATRTEPLHTPVLNAHALPPPPSWQLAPDRNPPPLPDPRSAPAPLRI